MSIYDNTLKNVAEEVAKIMGGSQKPEILAEAKSGYDLYHSQYSGAVQHALEHHGKKGLKVDSDDYHQKVATGPRKPSEGKTVSHNIAATDEKGGHHTISMQIYNKGGEKPYELNTYSTKVPKKQVKEDVDQSVNEGAAPAKEKVITVRHKVSGKELRVVDKAAEKYKTMGYEQVKEETQLDELSKDTLSSYAAKATDSARTMPGYGTNAENDKKTKRMASIAKAADRLKEAMSHQAATTMKHVQNPTPGEKKAAKDIKPGIAGYRDRVAMLKSAEARGALKEDDLEEAMSKQAATTMKHVQDATPGEKKAAKDIKPGIAGYRDRIAMLKSAQAAGRLKEGKAHTIPTTEKEKSLAALAAPKDKITHADVLTGRGVLKKEEVVAEGFPTVADARERAEREKTTGKFEKKTISTGTVYTKKHTKADAEHSEEKPKKPKMKMSEMANMYSQFGLKSLFSFSTVEEEVDSEQFQKELEIHKKKDKGEIRNDKGVAAPSTQGTKAVSEDYEILDANEVNGYAIATIDEKTLTEPETKKREEVVKSMKKNISGFKDRYGDRAKSVMYATATKIAKEKA